MKKSIKFLAIYFVCISFAIVANAQKKETLVKWGGFYIGGNLGVNAVNNSMVTATTFTGGITSASVLNNILTFSPAYFGQTSVPLVNKAGKQDAKSSGFTGGVQLGYLFQKNKLVAGIEVDYNLFKQSKTVSGRDTYTNVTPGYQFEVKQTIKTDWLMTIRPKIGYATGKAFIYATGGLAFTNLNYQMNFEDFPPTPPSGSLRGKGVASNTIKETKTAAVLGLGAAININKNWSVKVEYLNTQFKAASANNNSQLITINSSGTVNGRTPLTNTIFTSDIKLKSNIFRVGFNYSF